MSLKFSFLAASTLVALPVAAAAQTMTPPPTTQSTTTQTQPATTTAPSTTMQTTTTQTQPATTAPPATQQTTTTQTQPATTDQPSTTTTQTTTTQTGGVTAATEADITKGASVYDQNGELVGKVDSVSSTGAIVSTGKARAEIPITSFGKNDKGLVVSITKAELDAQAKDKTSKKETDTEPKGD
jgi:membrane-bound lytic murein transglycosylase B